MFWLPTATFVASSLGMTQSTSIDVPYNIAERDVTLPLQVRCLFSTTFSTPILRGTE